MTMFLSLTVLAAMFFTSGGALMKSSEGLTRLWPSFFCMICFLCGAALQALAMRGNQMSVTYIFILGLEAALALAFGSILFHEPLTVSKLGGTVLILAGMCLLRQG